MVIHTYMSAATNSSGWSRNSARTVATAADPTQYTGLANCRVAAINSKIIAFGAAAVAAAGVSR